MEKILKKLKVSDKFKMVFRWIIGMFASAIIVSVFLTITITVSFRTFYNDAYSNTILEFEAQRDVQMIGKLVLLSVNSDNKEDTLKYIGVIDKKMQGISDNAAKLQENFDEPELTGALISELGKLKTIIDELNVPLKAEKYDEAYTIYDEKFYSQSEAVQAALNAIGTAAGEHATKELNTSSYLAVANIFFMIIVAIATILMSIRIAKVLTGIIVAPVQKIQQALGNLHDGKLNTDIEYDGEDEFAELIADYTDTCNNMHTIIEDAGRLLGEMAAGNFNINTNCEESYVGDFHVLIESMRKLNRQLDGTLKQITEMSNQVAIGSDQLEQSSQALAEGATDQAGAVEELTATVESVTNIATESADVASMAAEQMADAAKEAEKSKAEMDELIAAMDRITATSKEIENIIGAIEDIASQTNLLSLNASIEAARAGEAGRGFAVVADQIGKLAADSAQSAVDTRELIAKSLEEVEKGNEITRNTAEAIAQVLANMSKFAQAAAGSAEGSRTQAEMLRQIEAGIEQISTVVQSNSASAEQTSAVSEELSAQAESMKDLIDRFDLRAE